MSISKKAISLVSVLSMSALSLSLVHSDTANAQASRTNPGSTRAVQTPDALVVTGHQLVRAARYKEAVNAFSGALKLSPKNWQNLFYRGRTYSLLGESDKAIADLSESIKLNPENGFAFIERGKLYYTGPKNYKSALVDLTKAIKLLPNDASAHEYRGLVLAAMGKHSEAISEFTNTLALVGANPPMSREANLLKHFGEVNVEQVERIKARLYFLRGKSKNDAKQFPQSITDLDFAVKFGSSTYPVYLERAKALVKLKEKDKAIADIERATQLARTPEVYKTASAMYTELGEKQKATDAWKKAEPEAPPSTPASSAATAPSAAPGTAEPAKTAIPTTTPSTTPPTDTTPATPAQAIPPTTPEK